MKLVTFKNNDKEKIGVLSSDNRFIYALNKINEKYFSMNELIINSNELERKTWEKEIKAEEKVQLKGEKYNIREVKILAPIPEPRQDVICLGINYLDHAKESAAFKKEAFDGKREKAVYFSKRVNEAVGHEGFIESHKDIVTDLDYEVELGVIIGRDAKGVSKEEALDYVFGYTIINDISARTLQNQHKQWYFGKSLDGFLPMGPCIVTAEEIQNPHNLNISSRVNGELRQRSNTSYLIFDVAFVISELSKGMTLKAGTIISMGTPAGVGMGFKPPRFLKSGDVVKCEIEGIGTLINTVE